MTSTWAGWAAAWGRRRCRGCRGRFACGGAAPQRGERARIAGGRPGGRRPGPETRPAQGPVPEPRAPGVTPFLYAVVVGSVVPEKRRHGLNLFVGCYY